MSTSSLSFRTTVIYSCAIFIGFGGYPAFLVSFPFFSLLRDTEELAWTESRYCTKSRAAMYKKVTGH